MLQGTYVTKNKNSPRDVQLVCQNSAFRRFVSTTISPNFGPLLLLLLLFENGKIFFSELAYCPHVHTWSGENGPRKTHLFNNALQSGDF